MTCVLIRRWSCKTLIQTIQIKIWRSIIKQLQQRYWITTANLYNNQNHTLLSSWSQESLGLYRKVLRTTTKQKHAYLNTSWSKLVAVSNIQLSWNKTAFQMSSARIFFFFFFLNQKHTKGSDSFTEKVMRRWNNISNCVSICVAVWQSNEFFFIFTQI